MTEVHSSFVSPERVKQSKKVISQSSQQRIGYTGLYAFFFGMKNRPSMDSLWTLYVNLAQYRMLFHFVIIDKSICCFLLTMELTLQNTVGKIKVFDRPH